ncbi:hypothetical protein [Pseudomonas sp. NGC7]|uniref:hypothetical protein n=1 Tax=Pseudomonas sp. NGC7 TaxID=3341775 RepID=UPI0037DB5581
MTTSNNATFSGAAPSWANACVGNNGNPGYIEYSKGFSAAANILIEQVLAGRGLILPVDDLVYPVCFNMRHSVELRLKGAIQELADIAEIQSQPFVFDLSGSHDIGNIWNFFKSQSELLDERYIEVNKSINSTISDIAAVDATGQTFRYPVSNESQKHLTEIALINFILLKNKFCELEKNLDTLHSLNLWLKQEYQQGTFTSKLSRPKIYELARALPPKSEWSHPQFTVTKKELMKTYNLGSRDLTKAIDKIKNHYFLSYLIGAPLPIKGISEDQILSFFENWTSQNSDTEEKSKPSLGIDNWERKESIIDDIKKQAESQQATWSKFEKLMTPDFLAGLHALYYFARDKTYTEYYDTAYELASKEIAHEFKCGPAAVRDSFMHIHNKTNAASNILISLFALGHKDLAETIIRKHTLDTSLHWIEKARSGQLFSYPEFAKY